MKEDFDTDLGEEQKAEQKAVDEFKALKATKLAEIDTAKKAIIQYDHDIAHLGEQNVEAVKELGEKRANTAISVWRLQAVLQRHVLRRSMLQWM